MSYTPNVAQKKDVEELAVKLKSVKQEFENSRFDLITILGIFAGLITFLGLEVQVFKTIDNPLIIIGVSIFFVASILLFILTLNMIIKIESPQWKDFKNPIYIILVFLLCLAIGFIVWGVLTIPV